MARTDLLALLAGAALAVAGGAVADRVLVGPGATVGLAPRPTGRTEGDETPSAWALVRAERVGRASGPALRAALHLRQATEATAAAARRRGRLDLDDPALGALRAALVELPVPLADLRLALAASGATSPTDHLVSCLDSAAQLLGDDLVPAVTGRRPARPLCLPDGRPALLGGAAATPPAGTTPLHELVSLPARTGDPLPDDVAAVAAVVVALVGALERTVLAALRDDTDPDAGLAETLATVALGVAAARDRDLHELDPGWPAPADVEGALTAAGAAAATVAAVALDEGHGAAPALAALRDALTDEVGGTPREDLVALLAAATVALDVRVVLPLP